MLQAPLKTLHCKTVATSGAANGMNRIYEAWTSGDLMWQAFWACKKHVAFFNSTSTKSVKLVPRNLIYPNMSRLSCPCISCITQRALTIRNYLLLSVNVSCWAAQRIQWNKTTLVESCQIHGNIVINWEHMDWIRWLQLIVRLPLTEKQVALDGSQRMTLWNSSDWWRTQMLTNLL